MSTVYTVKKPAHEDWHRADIVCALRKAGWSLRQLSLHHGYDAGSLRKALASRWPHAERLIAEAIGVRPEQIWPTRYGSDGRRPTINDSTHRARRNVHARGAQ